MKNPLKKAWHAIEDLTPRRRRIKRRLAAYAGHTAPPKGKRRRKGRR